jgi:uncharacterized protein YodC (DUF2158 family)
MKKLLFIMCLALCSCASAYLSPSVRFQNSSSDGSEIRNIQVVWNGYRLLKESGPFNACKYGGGQSFALRKKSDLFGPVHAQWQNAKGEKISKDFIFKKEDLASNPYHLSTIVLFFTQTDVEYYTSDNPRFKEIEWEKSGNWVNKWFEKEGVRRCVNDPKEVKRLKEQFK